MWLFLAFLAIPLIEIALFIQIGGIIGLGWTLAIVILTAMVGTWLVRSQGALAISQVRNSFETLNDPTEPLAHGAMILFAGALLLTPGFFTDAFGFALLLPPFRRVMYQFLRKRIKFQSVNYGHHSARHSPYDHTDVIDGDYTEATPSDQTKPSGWTRD